MTGRWMALDIGDRRIGVAVTDPLGMTAQGVEVFENRGPKNNLAHMQELVRAWQVERLIFGLPRNMNGTEGDRALSVRALAAEWGQALGVAVDFSDERLTTVEAHKALIEGGARRDRRKQVVDRLAAVLILENYMQAHQK